MPKQRHEAFSIEYSNLASELFSEITLFNPADMDNRIKTFAIWDTGATISSVAPSVAKKLCLEPVDSVLLKE